MAAVFFPSAKSRRAFEIFALIVLAYLTLTSVAFLLGSIGQSFPTYILDENLGIHADRARGPFLQAVANGVTLNLLGFSRLTRFASAVCRGPCSSFCWLRFLSRSLPQRPVRSGCPLRGSSCSYCFRNPARYGRTSRAGLRRPDRRSRLSVFVRGRNRGSPRGSQPGRVPPLDVSSRAGNVQ